MNTTDPLWISFQELAQALGIKVCTLRDRMVKWSDKEAEVKDAEGNRIRLWKSGNRWRAKRADLVPSMTQSAQRERKA